MKKTVLLAIVLLICQLSKAQEAAKKDRVTDSKESCITIGVLQGGGSLIGADIEIMPLSRLGFQFGAGLVGVGCGINYHFKPWVKSSFLSLQYWHQGMGNTYVQSLVGPSYVFRARKIFTCQIGVGFLVEKGPKYYSAFKKEVPAMLTYAIGVYIPW